MADVTPGETRERLLEFALGLPGAWEDHPWGERVAKVGKKVFLFGGTDEGPWWPSVTVKLVSSHPLALAQPGVTPTGYGLGRSGWVTIKLDEASLPYEALRDWVEESYRAVAPKRLLTQARDS